MEQKFLRRELVMQSKKKKKSVNMENYSKCVTQVLTISVMQTGKFYLSYISSNIFLT